MTKIILEVEKREKKEKKSNKIPAILYGRGVESEMLWVDKKDFIKIYQKAGESTLLDVVVGDNKRSVLIHDVQLHPLTGEAIHIDLYQVRMDEKIETDIELTFIGVAPAVKELGGTFVKNLDKIPVQCLPGDLVSNIEVNIDSLETFDDHIYIKDLQIPKGIEVLLEEETVVTLVTPPRTQAEMDKLNEDVEGDISQVEGMEERGDEDADAEMDDNSEKNGNKDGDKEKEEQQEEKKTQ